MIPHKQEDVVVTCSRLASSNNFYDPVSSYMEAKQSDKSCVLHLLSTEFQICGYGFLDFMFLCFRIFSVFYMLRDGRKYQLIHKLLDWLYWKFSYI